MAPILGIISSSITGNLVTNSYSSIATVTVGSGGASSVSFSSIPQTYTHLQIRAIIRNTSTNDYSTQFYFNSDNSISSYTQHRLRGDGSSATAYGTGTGTAIGSVYECAPLSNQTSNAFGTFILDILDYTNTNKYKTTRSLSGFDVNGTGKINLGSSLWVSTSAITSITIKEAADNIAQYSSFALYGIQA